MLPWERDSTVTEGRSIVPQNECFLAICLEQGRRIWLVGGRLSLQICSGYANLSQIVPTWVACTGGSQLNDHETSSHVEWVIPLSAIFSIGRPYLPKWDKSYLTKHIRIESGSNKCLHMWKPSRSFPDELLVAATLAPASDFGKNRSKTLDYH